MVLEITAPLGTPYLKLLLEAPAEVSIEAVSDNSQLSVKFPNGEILSLAKATRVALELDYRGQLFRPLLSQVAFSTNTITVPHSYDNSEKVI